MFGMNDNGSCSIYDTTLFCINVQLYSINILKVSRGDDGTAKGIAAVHCWPDRTSCRTRSRGRRRRLRGRCDNDRDKCSLSTIKWLPNESRKVSTEMNLHYQY